MAKGRTTVFFCQSCGYESPKWLGQCPGCKAWNSLVEERSVTAGGKREKAGACPGVQSAPAVLNEISMEEERRTETGMGELDRGTGRRNCYRLADAGRRRPGYRQIDASFADVQEPFAKKAAHFVCIRRGILTPDQNACDADRRFFGHAGAVL